MGAADRVLGGRRPKQHKIQPKTGQGIPLPEGKYGTHLIERGETDSFIPFRTADEAEWFSKNYKYLMPSLAHESLDQGGVLTQTNE